MKTRFDNTKHWITSRGELIPIADMETSHLLNTVKMLIQKPTRTQAMLVIDIERAECPLVWCPDYTDNRAKSIYNATSLTADELVEYVKGTPLFNAMLTELEHRGVNTKNTIELFESTDVLK